MVHHPQVKRYTHYTGTPAPLSSRTPLPAHLPACLYECAYSGCLVAGITQRLLFCDWLMLLSTESSRFLHVVAGIRMSLLYKKKIAYLVVLSLSHSTLDLGCIMWDIWSWHVDSGCGGWAQ